MNLQDLENILRDEGTQNLPKVDTEKLWQRVEPHIPKKKRRIGFYNIRFLFGLIFLAIITAGFIFNFYDSDKLNPNDIEYFSSAKHNVDQTLAKGTSFQSLDINSDDSKESAININAQNPIQNYEIKRDANRNIKNEASQIDESILSVTSKRKTSSDLIVEELSSVNESESESQSIERINKEIRPNTFANNQKFAAQIKPHLSNENFTSSTENYDVNNIQSNIGNNNKSTPDLSSSDRILGVQNIVVQNDKHSVTEGSNEIDASVSNIIKNQTVNDFKINAIQSHDKKLKNISSRYQASVSSLIDSKFLGNPTLVHHTQNENKRWMVSLAGGSFLASKTLTANTTRLQEEFDSRVASESILDAWNSSIALSYNINPKLRLSVGFDYSWINEQSEKTLFSQELINLPEVVIAQIITGNSVENVIASNVSVTRTTERKIRRINTYKWIDVPIEMIYASQLSRNLSFDIGLGFSKNITLRASGFWHPDNTQEYGLDLDENQYLKSDTGFSLLGHVGLRYELSNQFGIFSRVRIKNQFSPITNSTYGIDQSYRLVGVEAGLISKF